MVVNVFFVCAFLVGFGSYSMLLMFHAIVGIMIGADLKVASHSENGQRFRTFLAANGIFLAFEVVLLIWMIVDIAVTWGWAPYILRYRYRLGPYALFGSGEGIAYILIEITLNVIFEFIVHSAYKRGRRPSGPSPSVSVVAWGAESDKEKHANIR